MNPYAYYLLVWASKHISFSLHWILATWFKEFSKCQFWGKKFYRFLFSLSLQFMIYKAFILLRCLALYSSYSTGTRWVGELIHGLWRWDSASIVLMKQMKCLISLCYLWMSLEVVIHTTTLNCGNKPEFLAWDRH